MSLSSLSLSLSLLFLQALREEVAFVERRAEEERVAHNATKMVSNLNYLFLKFLCSPLF